MTKKSKKGKQSQRSETSEATRASVRPLSIPATEAPSSGSKRAACETGFDDFAKVIKRQRNLNDPVESEDSDTSEGEL